MVQPTEKQRRERIQLSQRAADPKVRGNFHSMLQGLKDNRFKNMELTLGKFNERSPCASIRLPTGEMVLVNLANCNGDDLREAFAHAKATNLVSDMGELVGIMSKHVLGKPDNQCPDLFITHNGETVACRAFHAGKGVVFAPK